MNIGQVLRAKWYPKFKPNQNIKTFEIHAWKILVINSGTVAGKPLLCQRLSDKKTKHFNFHDLENGFLEEDKIIEFMKLKGFKVSTKKEGILQFSLKSS